MAIFLYVGFVKSIPMEIEEAAIMDGAGPFSTFFLIVFPLLKPITATIMILDALWAWNDFLLPLLMITNNKKYTLILSASVFFGKYSTDWTALLAGLLMTSVPMVIFYLIFQKNIVKGVAAGAIKG
jgi:raffinose/stachyose/melibiose transport system permease protein